MQLYIAATFCACDNYSSLIEIICYVELNTIGIAILLGQYE